MSQSEEMKELLPCPFCGGEAYVNYSDRGELFGVRCNHWKGNGGSSVCMGAGAYADSKAGAITAWNTRATPSQPTQGVGSPGWLDKAAAIKDASKVCEQAETIQKLQARITELEAKQPRQMPSEDEAVNIIMSDDEVHMLELRNSSLPDIMRAAYRALAANAVGGE